MQVQPLRLFVGFSISEQWRQSLLEMQDFLRSVLVPRVAWVPPENMHVTLRFLGSVEQTLVPTICTALDSLSFSPCVLQMGKAGTFAGRGGARTVWMGLAKGTREVQELAALVNQTLLPLGFAAPQGVMTPHITLGRVRHGQNEDWGSLAQALPAVCSQALVVEGITLWQSLLKPDGARYTALHHCTM